MHDGQRLNPISGLVKTMQPKIGDLARQALSMAASVGGAMLLFMASFIVATIMTSSNPQKLRAHSAAAS